MTRRVTIAAVLALVSVASVRIATGEGRWHATVARARDAGVDAYEGAREHRHDADWARGEAESACQRVVERATGEADGIDAPMTRCLWHVACHEWLQNPVRSTWRRCQVEIGER